MEGQGPGFCLTNISRCGTVSLSPPLDALYPFWRCQALPRCPGIWAGKETSRYNGQHRRGLGGMGRAGGVLRGRRGAVGQSGSPG